MRFLPPLMVFSRFSSWCRFLVFYLGGVHPSKVYYSVLIFLFLVFFVIRVPYTYGAWGFACIVVFSVSWSFLSIISSHVFCKTRSFISMFIPSETPEWIAPFICLVETLSFFIRPVVTMIRPFFNLSAGYMLAKFVAGASLLSLSWAVLWVFWFFYEVFVAVVHWYIVNEIVGFTAGSKRDGRFRV